MATAIIVAAGESRRMGALGDKQFVPLADRPLVAHAVHAFEHCRLVDEVILVCQPTRVEEASRLFAEAGLRKLSRVVAGGARRQESVARGLAHIGGGIVAVHDGARPLVTPELIAAAIEALPGWDGVVAAMRATDTVKEADADGAVRATLDRDSVWLAQTPQVFDAAVLKEALTVAERDGVTATDDAALVERLGWRVRVIEGTADNIKITTPTDLERAEMLLAKRNIA